MCVYMCYTILSILLPQPLNKVKVWTGPLQNLIFIVSFEPFRDGLALVFWIIMLCLAA